MKSILLVCALGGAYAQAGRKFSTEWPKRTRTDYVSIAKTTDNEYWMEGYYSTLVN